MWWCQYVGSSTSDGSWWLLPVKGIKDPAKALSHSSCLSCPSIFYMCERTVLSSRNSAPLCDLAAERANFPRQPNWPRPCAQTSSPQDGEKLNFWSLEMAKSMEFFFFKSLIYLKVNEKGREYFTFFDSFTKCWSWAKPNTGARNYLGLLPGLWGLKYLRHHLLPWMSISRKLGLNWRWRLDPRYSDMGLNIPNGSYVHCATTPILQAPWCVGFYYSSTHGQ